MVKITIPPKAPVKQERKRFYPRMKEPTRLNLYKAGLHVHKTRLLRDAKRVYMTGGIEAMSAKDLNIIVDHFHDEEIELPGIGMRKCSFYLFHPEDVEHLTQKDREDYIAGRSELAMFIKCADERSKRGYH